MRWRWQLAVGRLIYTTVGHRGVWREMELGVQGDGRSRDVTQPHSTELWLEVL